MACEMNRAASAAPAGDSCALGKLLAAARPVAERLLAKQGVPAAERADLVSDAQVVALEQIKQWNPERARFETWFASIAAKVAANWKRDSKARAALDGFVGTSPLAGLGAEPETPEQALAREQDRAELRRRVAALPPKRRELVQRYMDGERGADRREVHKVKAALATVSA